MKNAVMGILGMYLSLFGISALADNSWHTVLSCNNGAAVVDNESTYTDKGVPMSGAQLVISDPGVVKYFEDNGFGGNNDGHLISNKNEWIAQSYMPGAGQSQSILSFFFGDEATSGGYSDSMKNRVTYDGSGLRVVVTNTYLGGATGQVPFKSVNWYFQNCVQQ